MCTGLGKSPTFMPKPLDMSSHVVIHFAAVSRYLDVLA